MYSFKKYEKSDKDAWDAFISLSKNANFLFYRDYMEYHADRFQDHSLLIYHDNKLIALLPANIQNDILYSHQGLTFGGLLSGEDMKAEKMFYLIPALKEYLASQGIKELIYKAIPYIYHKQASEEDIFALYKHGATLNKRALCSVINLANDIKFAKARRGCIKKALQAGLTVRETSEIDHYFEMMEALLKEKYDAKPVHTAQEMKYLQEKFPQNIKLFSAYKGNEMLAGILIYESDFIVKTQYISSIQEGRNLGAVDLIVDHLVHEVYKNKRFFDFGTSCAKTITSFNESLVAQKEMFSARSVVMDTYSL